MIDDLIDFFKKRYSYDVFSLTSQVISFFCLGILFAPFATKGLIMLALTITVYEVLYSNLVEKFDFSLRIFPIVASILGTLLGNLLFCWNSKFNKLVEDL